MQRQLLINFLLIVFLFFAVNASAQFIDSTKNQLHKKNIFTLAFYKQDGKDSMVDFIDGVYRILKINKDRSQNEVGKKTHLTFIPGIEYSLGTGMAASLNANAVLPTKQGTLNNSTYFTEVKITQKQQIVSQFATNIWSKNGAYNFNSNWSYLKYPQLDYGLGSNTTLHSFDNLDYSYLKLYQSILKRVMNNLYFGAGILPPMIHIVILEEDMCKVVLEGINYCTRNPNTDLELQKMDF